MQGLNDATIYDLLVKGLGWFRLARELYVLLDHWEFSVEMLPLEKAEAILENHIMLFSNAVKISLNINFKLFKEVIFIEIPKQIRRNIEVLETLASFDIWHQI